MSKLKTARAFLIKINSEDPLMLKRWSGFLSKMGYTDFGQDVHFFDYPPVKDPAKDSEKSSDERGQLIKAIMTWKSSDGMSVMIKVYTLSGEDVGVDFRCKERIADLFWDYIEETWQGWVEGSKPNERAEMYIRRTIERDLVCRELSVGDKAWCCDKCGRAA